MVQKNNPYFIGTVFALSSIRHVLAYIHIFLKCDKSSNSINMITTLAKKFSVKNCLLGYYIE